MGEMVNWVKNGYKFLGKKVGDFLGKKIGRRISIAAAATLALAGGTAGLIHYSQKDDSYKIVQANDVLDDNYQGKIPMVLEDGTLFLIDDNEIIIVKDDIKRGKNDVIYMSPYNEIVQGRVDAKYLKESKFSISEELLKDYKYVYKTIPKEGADIRLDPTIDESTVISSLSENEFVLASTEYVSVNDGFSWIPVIKIDQSGIYQGYVKSDFLEKEGTIEDGRFDKKTLSTMSSVEQKPESSTTEAELDNSEETTIQQGQNENYEIIQDDYIKDISKIVNTEIDGNIPLNCRANPSGEADIITTIPYGSKITATGNRATNEGREWIEVIYKQEGKEDIKGWVAETYLEDQVIEKQVDTSMDKVDKLNMRNKPGLDSEIIMEIETNKIIKVIDQNFNNPIECDGLSWVKIKISGQVGYVASKYLKDVEKNNDDVSKLSNMEIYQNIINNTEKNQTGRITGIDVSAATSDKMEIMAKNGINQSVVETANLGVLYDVNDVKSSKINFVMIKIGAMMIDSNVICGNDIAMQTIKKCEELGIPYGLYFYSESINKKEAQSEYNFITNFKESLKSINPRYNLLPLVIDVELDKESINRQTAVDVTETKAYLANLLQENNENVIAYTSMKAASTTDELSGIKCFSIPRFKELTGINDFWYVVPKEGDYNSNVRDNYKNFIKSTPSDINVVMRQAILDGNINGINVDVDIMEEDYFKECIRKALKIDEIEKNEANEDKGR